MLPKARLRAFMTLFAFLLVLTIAAGFLPRSFDATFVILDLGALVVGSIIIIVKSIRSGRTDIYGQIGTVPMSWKRWIVDDAKNPPGDDSPKDNHVA